MELDDYKTRLQIEQSRDNNEAQLEQLSQELRRQVELARQMFGTMTSESSEGRTIDPNVELRLRFIQLEEQLKIERDKIKELEHDKVELEKNIEATEAQNVQLCSDISRFRQVWNF